MPIITSAAVAVSVSVMRRDDRWRDTWASSFRHIIGSALITGASQGLGRQFARVLAAHGAAVVLAARQTAKQRILRRTK
jgi:NADPH:quinone reductase-like Zn-dependent oxidoreductase